MKKVVKHLPKLLMTLGLMVTSGVVTTGCLCFMHQPELPDGAMELKKSK